MPATNNQDRRGFRFALDASAEVAPEASPNATLKVRATELGLHGCYLETPAPFPPETPVLVKIFHANEYFEAKATVLYSPAITSAATSQRSSQSAQRGNTKPSPPKGMGLTFRDINPYCRTILQKWILAALHKPSPDERPDDSE